MGAKRDHIRRVEAAETVIRKAYDWGDADVATVATALSDPRVLALLTFYKAGRPRVKYVVDNGVYVVANVPVGGKITARRFRGFLAKGWLIGAPANGTVDFILPLKPQHDYTGDFFGRALGRIIEKAKKVVDVRGHARRTKEHASYVRKHRRQVEMAMPPHEEFEFHGREPMAAPAAKTKKPKARAVSYAYAGEEHVIREHEVREIPLALIEADPKQPRKTFDETALNELAASIKVDGLLQAIVVRPHPQEPGKFMIVAGERRYRAKVKLGDETIASQLRFLSDGAVRRLQMTENLSRANMNPIEEAEGYADLIGNFDETTETLADMIGKSESYIIQRLSLLNLAEDIQHLIKRKQMPVSYGFELARLGTRNEQFDALKKITEEKASVEDVRRYVDAIRAREAKTTMFKEPAEGPEMIRGVKVTKQKLDAVKRRYNNLKQAVGKIFRQNMKDNVLLPRALRGNVGREIEYLDLLEKDIRRLKRTLETAHAAQEAGTTYADVMLFQQEQRSKRGKKAAAARKGK